MPFRKGWRNIVAAEVTGRRAFRPVLPSAYVGGYGAVEKPFICSSRREPAQISSEIKLKLEPTDVCYFLNGLLRFRFGKDGFHPRLVVQIPAYRPCQNENVA